MTSPPGPSVEAPLDHIELVLQRTHANRGRHVLLFSGAFLLLMSAVIVGILACAGEPLELWPLLLLPVPLVFGVGVGVFQDLSGGVAGTRLLLNAHALRVDLVDLSGEGFLLPLSEIEEAARDGESWRVRSKREDAFGERGGTLELRVREDQVDALDAFLAEVQHRRAQRTGGPVPEGLDALRGRAPSGEKA